MKNIKVLATILVAIIMSGCAGQIKKLPIQMADTNTGATRDVYLSMTTVGDTLDRSSSITQLGYDSGKTDADGNPIIVQIAAEQQTGNTVMGQVAIGVLNGTGAAYLQKRGMENSARTYADSRKCPEGTVMCNSSNIQVAGASAASSSDSESNANASIDSSSCPSGQCSAMPTFSQEEGQD
jgi:hypothetical protein